MVQRACIMKTNLFFLVALLSFGQLSNGWQIFPEFTQQFRIQSKYCRSRPGYPLAQENRALASNNSEPADEEQAKKNNQGQPSDGIKIPTSTPQTRKLQLAFTCKICDHRNNHFINKVAYTEGVVIVKCPGCSNRHLIADPKGLLDMPGFVNVQQYAASQGEKVQTNLPDLEKLNLELKQGEDGNVQIIPKIE
mmetsp:Transcript_14465/g.21287  ORF Transcript_14465/g.21287 Transcript_14465/m.21287 type:complete len:193 (-) Transcript_14465:106-684(-)|eukprot:CAMPEP_0113944930 /NCGR_PEP_ID=MMETSP1339-20121228/38019_1 /TAXON_ID=94617 /ORGANISM="Fibrocapsa japonica" /LENGTH=192 /DNA_ID=CAMNT_0000950297 /DNA_START=96 /DNA_END=674 /DNA_ORIENTATION=+ /assembly_acc=CAM_ASM_000762